MRATLARLSTACSLALATFSHTAAAQTPNAAGDDDALARTLASWIALPVAPGRDVALAARLTRELPGWTADARGNLTRRTGSGAPRRVVACALDVPQYVVSAITPDGYLRVHRAGNASPQHPLWDQFHEAQRIKVLTRSGERAGVVAVANGHFARQHRNDTTVTWVDQLWVDVGVSSRSEAESLGITLLDPVLADRPAWTFEGNAAGPAAGARAACAAVVAAASSGAPSAGETTWLLTTQRAFGWVGLSGILARMGRIDALTIVEGGRASAMDATVAIARAPQSAIARTAKLDSMRVLAPKVRFAGSFVESIHAADARALYSTVAAAGGVSAPPMWNTLRLDTARVLPTRRDSYGDVEQTFIALADLPGVPGHEWRVRSAILGMLPEWARKNAIVDSAGNLIVAAGPDRDSVAFMAHMDEVAFEVERIASDGTVSLGRRGGVVATAWEGQTALLHFEPDANGRAADPLRGIFIPRDSARIKQPPQALTAWFGMDSAQLVARGVRVGLGVTSYKRAGRLAGTRITGRSSDDRTGSTALLLAARALDPATLTRKVMFAWSTREEIGLFGARAFATQYGASLARVYSIDTFVSSDTPLELPTFAFAPLGRGVVMRGLDDAAMSPLEEMVRVERVARANAIPLQIGTTHGGTDGSAIAMFGAPNVGLSWPGRYSHSPGEVLDLRDVRALSRLIHALAVER